MDKFLKFADYYHKGNFLGMVDFYRNEPGNVQQSILIDGLKKNAYGLTANTRIDMLFQLSRRLV